jgi:hypothetical protein
MGRALIILGVAALCAARAVPADAAGADHLQCFKVKDPLPKASYSPAA